MGKVLRLSAVLLNNIKWWFISILWKFKPQPKAKEITNKQYSIGVVTYVKRYEIHFLPLIKQLVTLFPDTQLIVAINGYYDHDIQKQYLKKIMTQLDTFKNVIYFHYDEGQSLSKLWNQLVIHSNSEKTFIFNDDIQLATGFRTSIEKSIILNHDCGIINGSWSHFLISKSIIKKVGWFDERFPGVGYEDHDYEIRLTLKGLPLIEVNVNHLKNIVYKTKDFSYGNNIETVFEKYSSVNEKHYLSKWEFSETEKEGFVFVRIIQGYAKLKTGMETPNFYTNIEIS